jgi:hypothetical protein
MTKAQKRLVDQIRDGCRLWWCGDNGPELNGTDVEESLRRPQKRVVRALLGDKTLRWKEYANDGHRECGICEIEVA